MIIFLTLCLMTMSPSPNHSGMWVLCSQLPKMLSLLLESDPLPQIQRTPLTRTSIWVRKEVDGRLMEVVRASGPSGKSFPILFHVIVSALFFVLQTHPSHAFPRFMYRLRFGFGVGPHLADHSQGRDPPAGNPIGRLGIPRWVHGDSLLSLEKCPHLHGLLNRSVSNQWFAFFSPTHEKSACPTGVVRDNKEPFKMNISYFLFTCNFFCGPF